MKEKRDGGVCLRERGTSWDCVREGESERERGDEGVRYIKSEGEKDHIRDFQC